MSDAEHHLARGIDLQSREELERAAALAADDPEMLFRVASALQGVGAVKPAVAAMARVIDIADEDFLFAVDLIHLGGLLARDVDDDERAEPLLRTAFEAAPETRGHGHRLAALLIDHGRYDEALDVVQGALEHRPGDEDLVELRDWLLAERS